MAPKGIEILPLVANDPSVSWCTCHDALPLENIARFTAAVGIWGLMFVFMGMNVPCAILLGAVLLIVAFLAQYPLIPKSHKPCEIIRAIGGESSIERGSPIRIMSWNIQYCAGRKQTFFYEGGKAVTVPLDDVMDTMKVIADIISDSNPDIVFLQEVDINSRRTCHVNQLEGILKHLDESGCTFPHVCSTPYHQCCYVPAPAHEHTGKVDFHMAGGCALICQLYQFLIPFIPGAVLSKFPISKATRHQLPQLNESYIRRHFNLKRAVMDVRFKIKGGGEFAALNTHLSAFAFNDGTPEREISMLIRHTDQLDDSGVPWVLAGDFNQLPPGTSARIMMPATTIRLDFGSSWHIGDDPKRLGRSAQYYGEVTPITKLLEKQRSVMDVRQWEENPAACNTYLPNFNKKDVADRVLDWAFCSADVKPSKFEVQRHHRHVLVASDHLPLAVEVVF
jgi:endonuclease/exonuclease/phosphatase family metal-dependent hydrolase